MRSNLSSVLMAVIVALAAGGYPGVPKADEQDGSEPYVGTAFDAFVLSQPRPSDFVIFDGESRRFARDGASGANERWQMGRGALVVESQRSGYQVIAAGIAKNSISLMDSGLRAIEWGYQPSVLGADGSFPEERDTDTAIGHAIHPKSEFVERSAHAVILIRQSDIAPTFIKQRAEALVPLIHLAAQRFIDAGDAEKFFKKGTNSSQLAFVAAALFESGFISQDAAMMATGNTYMRQILAMQRPDGVYVEKRGYDTNYQLNTVELVTTYTSLVEDPVFRATLLNANIRGVDWFLARVRPDGSVNTSGNSRTVACGPPVPGPGPKGPEIDQIAQRLYIHAFQAGLVPEIAPVADTIELHGQNYDHGRTCTQ